MHAKIAFWPNEKTTLKDVKVMFIHVGWSTYVELCFEIIAIQQSNLAREHVLATS